ncbi:multidrug efflux pump subunit AcrB [Balneicella halophila]|uniref:Multidrug efflux pump subunit AcrB n=1 Tax=Balneicella halophila TaxID=1537566 RepID=A0A7L4UN04_BALHA|nr:efflux RND transporter permease subunit [Balneicella halophila]PVX49922.1 multidrug efflux pump subunit AcrB [Balneicella halophila]
MKVDKEFSISSWAINNRNTVFIIVAILFIGGLVSYNAMPRESLPEVNISTIFVSTVYPGNSAEDVEKFVSEPLEEEIKNITGIREIKSTSKQDYSLIEIEFEEDITSQDAKQKVKDKVDIVTGQSDWPTLDGGSKLDPYIMDINISELVPIMNINLSGNYTPQQLKEYGELLQEDIEMLSEIKEVNIRGVEEMEVEVAVDIYKMTAATVTMGDIIGAIQRENVTISGGNIVMNDQRRNIRVIGQITEPKELNDIIVKNEGGSVYLRDVADINFRHKDKTTYAREYGNAVVMLDVMKKAGRNQLDAADKIYELVDDFKDKELPQNVHVSITSDMSTRTKAQVSEMENNILFGVFLVVGVLMFFLGVRNSLFVGIAIPLSMLMSIMILSAMGLTLNTMTLFALVMGLGMLVDNGIVVVENVYRLMDEGMPRKQAAKQGVGEIAWPIIASTATTLAAFAPLGFWPGVVGQFMMYFPITLSIVLGSSLFVALIINSMITSRFMIVDEKNMSNKKLFISVGIMAGIGIILLIIGFSIVNKLMIGFGNVMILLAIMFILQRYVFSHVVDYFQRRFLPRLENAYEKFLTFALSGKRAYFFFFGTIISLILTIILLVLLQPRVLFFPESDPNKAIAYIEFPEGTDIEKTNRFTKQIEENVFNVLKEYEEKRDDGSVYNYMAESIIAQVGEGAGNPQVDGASQAEMLNKGKVTVLFREYKYRRGKSSADVLTDIREAVKGYAGVNIVVDKDQNGPPTGYPINLELKGDDYNVLMKTAQNIREQINASGIPGIEELNIDVNQNKMERQVIVDRQKAGQLGLSTGQVGSALREAIYGFDASTFKDGEDEYDIMVRFNADNRYDMSALMHQELMFRNSQGLLYKVPIASVASVKDVATFSSIKRKDLKRVITIYSNVLEGYNANEIVQKMNTNLEGYDFPEGITYEFTGEQEKMKDNMDFLSRALLVALALIMLIIVTQFNSISKPILIMLSVLFSFIGVFLGMLIFGNDFVIMMTMMGVIALAGIVVNNAIVLIDYTQLLIDRKKRELGIDEEMLLPKEEYYKAIVQGGKSRLRPVLLTAITTIFGLIPLAIGFNFDFFSFFTTYNPDIHFGGDNTKFWGPLSWTIVYGLTFATFLTLIIVPVMFYLLNRGKIRVKGEKAVGEVK